MCIGKISCLFKAIFYEERIYLFIYFFVQQFNIRVIWESKRGGRGGGGGGGEKQGLGPKNDVLTTWKAIR